MKTKRKFLIIFCVVFGITLNAKNSEELQNINSQIWSNFTKAFETLDYELFDSLHSENLVRVGGDYKTIRDKKSYIESYQNRWANSSKTQKISFRFLERICKNSKASERGIYKLTVNPNTELEKVYFGKFHVILIKEEGVWKILVDYDSSEKNSINEDTYKKAYAIDDFKKY